MIPILLTNLVDSNLKIVSCHQFVLRNNLIAYEQGHLE